MGIISNQQKPLIQLLHSNGKLAHIIQKAQGLAKLENVLRTELADMLLISLGGSRHAQEMLESIHLSEFQHGRLHLSCDNAAVSTRLRYLVPELIQRLRHKELIPNLINIELSIIKNKLSPAPSGTAAGHCKISPTNSKLLRDTLAQLRR